MRWIVSLCRTNDDTADRGTTVLAIETKHGTFITDTSLLTYDKKKKLICCKVPLHGRDGSWRLYSLENNRTDGDEIEYGYPITCGDSRAVLLFKKFVCPGINVRCVKVSWLLFGWQLIFPFSALFAPWFTLCRALSLTVSFTSIQDCDCL